MLKWLLSFVCSHVLNEDRTKHLIHDTSTDLAGTHFYKCLKCGTWFKRYCRSSPYRPDIDRWTRLGTKL